MPLVRSPSPLVDAGRQRLLARIVAAWIFGCAAASAQDPEPWTPALLVNSSPTFRLTSAFQPADEGGAAPAVPPAPGAESTNSLLEQFNATTQLPARETVGQSFENPVTSLTLTPSTIGKTPAAVFVINQEMIRRSGAQTLPEALRMVPGVHVGSGNGLTPNVSIRGLGAGGNVPFSSRVLVLIDGRSIYEPIVGGVVWTPNDVVLQDIERIEIIRGPGATIWGANAVNGVINIITKSAADTQGVLVQSLGGSEYHNITVARYGAKVGDEAYLRVYGKFRDIDQQFRNPEDADSSFAFQREPANDGFHDFQGGFRFDKTMENNDRLSVQGRIAALPAGDAFRTPGSQQLLLKPNPAAYFSGNIQASWSRTFDDDSQLTFLGIYDRADNAVSFGQYHRDTYVLDGSYRWSWGDRHELLAGGQLRLDRDTFITLDYPAYEIAFDPASRTYNVVSWLIQDEIQIVPDDLVFLVGTKMEVNPFTGFEIQPSARLLKTIDDKRVAWAAVSRAVRRPNRIEEHVDVRARFPLPFGTIANISGNPKLTSDGLVAFETGYRAEPVEWFTWDVAAFLNLYDDLTQYIVDTSGPDLEVTNSNSVNAQSYGAEFSATLKMTETWSMTGAYSYLDIFAHAEPQDLILVTKGFEFFYEGNSPNNIAYLRNSWSPTKQWDLDVIGRYVDIIEFGRNPAYVEMDVRLAWRPRERLELAVVGQNLLDSAHAEFGTIELVPFTPLRTQVQRGVYGSLTYTY